MKKICQTLVLPVVACIAATGVATAKDAIRYKAPNPQMPMALAVEVPATQDMVFLSGAVPDLVDQNAAKDSAQAYDDTEAQTVSVLRRIEKTLQSMHLGMRDVVKMQVFLVGDPAHAGRMDFAGFMRGYRQFFGTKAQPELPARSVVQVAGLVRPGWLVEIEATAMRR